MVKVVEDELEYIDPDTRLMHFSSGRTSPLGEEAELSLFGTEAQRQIKQGVKEAELSAHETVGNITGSKKVNTFLKNLSDNVFTRLATDYVLDPLVAGGAAISTREGQEESGFFDRLSQNYMAQRMGRREARQEIDAESPGAALAGKIGSVGIDLAMPLPKTIRQSPTLTGAVFGAGSSDRSVFEDPSGFAKSTALGGAIGYGAGKVGEKLEKVASERRLLREAPEMERRAQQAHRQLLLDFRARAGDKLGKMQKDLGKYGIAKESMGVEDFIAREIGVSQLAGTKEGQELTNFFTTIEKNLPETMHASDVQKLFEAVEVRAANAAEAEIPIFQAFKEHLVERLPIGASQNKLMGQVLPKVERETMKVVDQVFNSLPANVVREIEKEFGKDAIKGIKESMRTNIKETLGSMSPQEFVQALESGDTSFLLNPLLQSETFQGAVNLPDVIANKAWMKGDTALPHQVTQALKKQLNPSIYEAQTRFQSLPSSLETRLQRVVQKNALDASIIAGETQKKVSSRISNAVGVQNPFTTRSPTNAAVGKYEAPTPPQVGRIAERFEKPLDIQGRGTGAAVFSGLGKLVGLPKVGAVIGGAKALNLGLEGTLRGLTSPSALGNIARQGIRSGGMKLMVEQISQTYPSYDNGIMRDPNDRKQAVAEIEQNPDVPLEDKAMLQAYINRGKSLETFMDR